jgi:carbon storage regulator
VGTLRASAAGENVGPGGEVGRVLVLTRRLGEGIMIGDDIEITVLSTEGTKVRLGIQAPAHVPVHRREIYLEIKGQGDETPAPGAEQPTTRSRRRRMR